MTSFQKAIKYLAIGLALFICITMFTGIAIGIRSILDNFNIINENDTDYEEVIEYNDEFQYLDINLNSTNLIIKNGSKFSVETYDKNIKFYKETDKLKIVGKSKKIINKKIKDFIITIPQNYIFKAVEINTGVGKVNVDGIKTDLLEMNLGAGKTILNNINSNKSILETGAGSVEINNSSLNDLNLELGAGKIDINATITGNSYIESGIAELNLLLSSSIHNYTFNFEKGIGEIKINGENIRNNIIIGEGQNNIKIKGGIGSINIKTLE